MNRILIFILLIVTIISCSNTKKRNLTNQIVLEDVKDSNDTVDFYIKQITLLDVERLKLVWVENAPGLNIIINITNKLNKNIYLIPSDWSASYFVGILPPELHMKKDTLYFVNFFDSFPKLIEPKSSISFSVSCWGSLFYVYNETQLDNTEPMLNLVKRLKFYYAPSIKEENIGQDTIVINNIYRLRTDANTKITSLSRLR